MYVCPERVLSAAKPVSEVMLKRERAVLLRLYCTSFSCNHYVFLASMASEAVRQAIIDSLFSPEAGGTMRNVLITHVVSLSSFPR